MSRKRAVTALTAVPMHGENGGSQIDKIGSMNNFTIKSHGSLWTDGSVQAQRLLCIDVSLPTTLCNRTLVRWQGLDDFIATAGLHML
eukprot:8202926-Pyramimonas_sp.AAC.1